MSTLVTSIELPALLRMNADCIEAFNRGEEIEFYDWEKQAWFKETRLVSSWGVLTPHRVKRAPVSRPWSKPDDVPGPVCWIRYKGNMSGAWSMVLSANTYGISSAGSFAGPLYTVRIGRNSWGDLSGFEYSTDRKTWHKCEVVE